MKPKYFVAYQCEPSSVTVDMLYAVYPHTAFYATAYGTWQESDLTLEFFQRQDYYHPCKLCDVRSGFNNISAHKLAPTTAIVKEQQMTEVAGTQPAI